MHPNWDVATDEMKIGPREIADARKRATHFEDGKTTLSDPNVFLTSAERAVRCKDPDSTET